MNSSLAALSAVNFFVADVADGWGPFLGVYLQQQHWTPGQIGLAMTIGGFAGMLATAPLGALVDHIRAKRLLVVVGALAIVFASFAVFTTTGFVAVTSTQIVTGIAAAAIAPALSAITLGLVGQAGFARQNGRNQAYNHAGNVVSAALAGAFGYWLGFGAVFAVMAAMAVTSVIALAWIDPRHIDYRAARGLAHETESAASAWSVLVTCKPLLVLAATLLLFHLGNAAMLPLLGQSLVAQGAGDGSAFTGATIVIAQLTMVPMALLAARLADTRGYWLVFWLALLALPIRGLIAAYATGPSGLVPVQILDGVGAGLLSVAVPGLIARILEGTGHINAGLGAVMTMQGIGASLSTAVAGSVADAFGYSTAFLALGAIALLALALWMATRRITVAADRIRPS